MVLYAPIKIILRSKADNRRMDKKKNETSQAMPQNKFKQDIEMVGYNIYTLQKDHVGIHFEFHRMESFAVFNRYA